MKKILIFIILLCYTGIFIIGNSLDIKYEENVSFIVKATVYTTDPKQTDNTPFVTASGFSLHHKNPKKHRIIAVSRDLHSTLPFGSKVRLENAGKYDGEYFVEDLMNKRFKNRIDILINPKDKISSFDSVKVVLIEKFTNVNGTPLGSVESEGQ